MLFSSKSDENKEFDDNTDDTNEEDEYEEIEQHLLERKAFLEEFQSSHLDGDESDHKQAVESNYPPYVPVTKEPGFIDNEVNEQNSELELQMINEQLEHIANQRMLNKQQHEGGEQHASSLSSETEDDYYSNDEEEEEEENEDYEEEEEEEEQEQVESNPLDHEELDQREEEFSQFLQNPESDQELADLIKQYEQDALLKESEENDQLREEEDIGPEQIEEEEQRPSFSWEGFFQTYVDQQGKNISASSQHNQQQKKKNNNITTAEELYSSSPFYSRGSRHTRRDQGSQGLSYAEHNLFFSPKPDKNRQDRIFSRKTEHPKVYKFLEGENFTIQSNLLNYPFNYTRFHNLLNKTETMEGFFLTNKQNVSKSEFHHYLGLLKSSKSAIRQEREEVMRFQNWNQSWADFFYDRKRYHMHKPIGASRRDKLLRRDELAFDKERRKQSLLYDLERGKVKDGEINARLPFWDMNDIEYQDYVNVTKLLETGVRNFSKLSFLRKINSCFILSQNSRIGHSFPTTTKPNSSNMPQKSINEFIANKKSSPTIRTLICPRPW
jgi:hypothetical protein